MRPAWQRVCGQRGGADEGGFQGSGQMRTSRAQARVKVASGPTPQRGSLALVSRASRCSERGHGLRWVEAGQRAWRESSVLA